MGNAFISGLKNEAPRGRDVTNEDRNSEGSQRGTQRDAEGSELSYSCRNAYASQGLARSRSADLTELADLSPCGTRGLAGPG